MYRQKSEIIRQIQDYHKQVAKLYSDIFERCSKDEIKSLIHDLYEHERDREKYLERHIRIAEAINCWLDFPCDKLSKQMADCFENINLGSEMNMGELLKIEMYFDDCLIKLYNILASENELTETVANIFYYMLKKTKKEKDILANMLYNSKSNLKERLAV
ncbi:MAG: hypothetical protein JXN62_12520 [Bacteroidales bacterium]|nr:hypothetical protein [Bacteroidales bacterium]